MALVLLALPSVAFALRARSASFGSFAGIAVLELELL
jgi:hypothetical protein